MLLTEDDFDDTGHSRNSQNLGRRYRRENDQIKEGDEDEEDEHENSFGVGSNSPGSLSLGRKSGRLSLKQAEAPMNIPGYGSPRAPSTVEKRASDIAKKLSLSDAQSRNSETKENPAENSSQNMPLDRISTEE